MTTTTDPTQEGTASLQDWLLRIAEAEDIADLDSSLHKAVRLHAQALHETGGSFGTAEIVGMESSAQLSALSAALHLRSLDVVSFWGPLLKHCLTGRSMAPLSDLQDTVQQAHALASVIGERPAGPVRDEVLRLATEAGERLEKWLPKATSADSPKAATRYSRGTFERSEDEDGNPIERAPEVPEKRGKPPESKLQSVLGWLLTLGVVAGLGAAVWMFSQKEPPPPTLGDYQSAVSTVQGEQVQDTQLVLTMDDSWISASREDRLADLKRLWGLVGTDGPLESIRVEAADGSMMAIHERGSDPDWGEERLRADQLGDRDDFSAPEADGDEETPTPAGQLARPLTAEEVRGR